MKSIYEPIERLEKERRDPGRHAKDAKIKEVRDRLSHIKDSEEGQEKMSDIIERKIKERDVARIRVMIQNGRDAVEIRKVFPEFTLDEIRAIEEQELAIA